MLRSTVRALMVLAVAVLAMAAATVVPEAPASEVGRDVSVLGEVLERPSPEAGDPVGVTAGERPRAQAPPSPRTWAVVVGIDDYPGDGYDLRAGVTDAKELALALDHAGVPQEQRRVLLDGAATANAVREALAWLVDRAGPSDTAVLFYSGHVRERSGDVDRDGEDVDETLLLADGQEIPDGEVAVALSGLRARHTWIAVAGCYAGGFDDVLAPGRVLTGAAPEGVLAYENDKFQLTYLVEYMVRRAMIGGGVRSVQEAFARAVADLQRDYPHRLPIILDQSDGAVTLG